MKKIAVFNDRWCSGGVEALWTNLFRFFRSSEFEFVLIIGQKETEIFDDILSQNNVRMIEINKSINTNPIKRNLEIKRNIKNILREEEFDIIHINVCNAIGMVYARLSKQCGIKCAIVHSHNTKIERDKFKIKYFAHRLMRLFYHKYCNYEFACSSEAGNFMFGQKSDYKLIKNGVDLKKFLYNNDYRNLIRSNLNIYKDELLLCHIGRFSEQKNHIYLIKLFAKICELDNKAKLILVGEGPKKREIQNYVSDLNLDSRVIFYGVSDEVNKIMAAADAFILPSLHEGLPVTAIEAQASGLKCFLANTISAEAKILESCEFIDLNKDIDLTAKQILSGIYNYDGNRESANDIMKEDGYSIEDVAENLLEFYSNI